MIAEKKRTGAPNRGRNEALKAQITALVAVIEKADSQQRSVPRYWRLGAKLARFHGDLEEKYALAKGRPRYYRARKINAHFSSLAAARAFQGSLRSLLRALRKGIAGRQPAPAVEKAACALLKAAKGNLQEALRALYTVGKNPSDPANERKSP